MPVLGTVPVLAGANLANSQVPLSTFPPHTPEEKYPALPDRNILNRRHETTVHIYRVIHLHFIDTYLIEECVVVLLHWIYNGITREQQERSSIAGRNAKWYGRFGRQFLIKLNIF